MKEWRDPGFMFYHGARWIARQSPKKVAFLPSATPGRHWNSVEGNGKVAPSFPTSLPG